MTATLATERLTLRKPQPKDWEAFRDFALSGGMNQISSGLDEGRAWRVFAAELGHWEIRGYGMWSVTMAGQDDALGLVGPWYPVDWPDTEIGWMVFSGAEGKGIAFEAAHAARAHAYDTLGWTRIVSYIAPENARSIRLAERLGATVDPDAAQPKPDAPCLVYVHPAKEVLQ